MKYRRHAVNIMSQRDSENAVEILPFSDDWMEGYLDLAENDDSRDPLYHKSFSREDAKKKILWQASRGATRAHFVAVQGGKVVGSGRGLLIPACAGDESRIATLNLMVARQDRGKGVGSLMLDSLCTELRRQGLKGIQLGMLEEWTPWIRFLEKHGFVSCDRTADVVLEPTKQTKAEMPVIDAIIRPARLPEERDAITGFMNSEREEELPWACAITPEFWTTGPGSKITDPKGFLIAEDKKTGEFLGVAWGSTFTDESGRHGMIDELDVAKGLLETPLRKRLMLQILDWLWGKGVKDIQTRVHIGFKHEEDLYKEVGFEFFRPAALWRKSIETDVR